MLPSFAVLGDHIARMFGNSDERRTSAVAGPCGADPVVESPVGDVGTNNVRRRRSTHERTRYVSGLSGSASESGSGCSDRRRTTDGDDDDEEEDGERSSRSEISDLSRTRETHTLESIRSDCLYITSMIVDDGCGNCSCRRGRAAGRRRERRRVEGVRIGATVISVILLAMLETTAGSLSVRMLTRPQTLEIDRGAAARLVCEFTDERFNLFDNPIVWRKHQRVRHRPLSSAAGGSSARVPLVDVKVEDDYDDDEDEDMELAIETIETSQINMMGNVIEPFASTGRFKPTWQPNPPNFLFSLTINNVSIVDIGNYSCEVGGPQNTIVALVTHQLTVRAGVDHLLITDEDGDVPVAIAASNYSYPPPGGHSPFIHRPLLVLIEGRPSSLRCIAVGGHPTPSLRIHITGGRSGRDGGWEPTASAAAAGGDGDDQTPSSMSSQPSSSSLLSSAGRRRWFSSSSLDDRGDDNPEAGRTDRRTPFASTASSSLSSPMTVVSTWSDQGRRGLRSFRRITELGSRVPGGHGREDSAAAAAAAAVVGKTVKRRGGTDDDVQQRRRTWFTVGLADDGAEVRCTATVGGLPVKVASSRIVVQHLSVTECVNGTATLGERNVNVRCELRSRPDVTSLRWIVDDNGTSVSEGEVANEYWTIIMDRTDGVLEVQLFLRQTRPASFRSYTLVADNGVASAVATVWLLRKESVRPTRIDPSHRGRKPDPTSSFDKYVFPFVRSRSCHRSRATRWSTFVPLVTAVYLASAILNSPQSSTMAKSDSFFLIRFFVVARVTNFIGVGS